MGIRIAGHRTRWAVVVLAVVAATLTGGSAAQAAGPQGGAAAEPRAGVAAWSSFPQIITNFASGKCLQPKAAALNALVEQRTCDTTNSLQKWRSEDAGSGFVRLRNVGSNLCMDLQANSEAEVGNGTLIQVFVCHATSRPAATKPTLLKVLAGCRINRSRAASQKFAPRPTSAPSQPRHTARASRQHETTATAPAMRIGLRSRRMGVTVPPARRAVGGSTVRDRDRVRGRMYRRDPGRCRVHAFTRT